MNKKLTPRNILSFVQNWAAVIAIIVAVVVFSILAAQLYDR